MMRNPQMQKGQIGLVVLLIMTGLMSVGIAAVNQSTQDLRITRAELESTQAFNAAERGMEEALTELNRLLEAGADLPTGPQPAGTSETGEAIEYELSTDNRIDMPVADNTVVTLDLRGDVDRSWVFEWGDTSLGCSGPSIVIAAYDVSNYTVRRWAFRPNGCNEISGFADGQVVDQNYRSNVIGFGNNEDVIRVKVVGGDTNLRANKQDGSGSNNIQMYVLKSTAVNQDSKVTKAIEIRRGTASLPAIFDYALFSGDTIVKNVP